MSLTIEECLHSIEDRAALLRYVGETTALNPNKPDNAVMNGLGEVCAEIQEMARKTGFAIR